jgi:phosphoribosylformimino-5-aminoimidazole carboxamide ribotide isomerase
VQIIPVIDLQGGHVVHARRGERAAYAPIRSALAAGADPVEIAAALLRLHPFDSLYLADIDAIQRRGHNSAVIAAIHGAFPDVELWVDTGIADLQEFLAWQSASLGRAVIGTECVTDCRLIDELRSARGRLPPVLSLDFGARGDRLGPIDVLARSSAWPDDVIVMTLARVGANLGPDTHRISVVLAAATGHRVFAAGGVRGADDLHALDALGAAGALVASSLHDGRLGSADLARSARPRAPVP